MIPFWIGVFSTLIIVFPVVTWMLFDSGNQITELEGKLRITESALFDYVEKDLRTPLELSTAARTMDMDPLATHLEAYEHWDILH